MLSDNLHEFPQFPQGSTTTGYTVWSLPFQLQLIAILLGTEYSEVLEGP
jgi:hypothetical protein